jgi:hypothetical protein
MAVSNVVQKLSVSVPGLYRFQISGAAIDLSTETLLDPTKAAAAYALRRARR